MRRLLAELAAASMHPVDGVWAANGSNEVLTQLLEAYGGPGRRAAVLEPTYLLHARLCHLTNTEVEHLALGDDFVLGPPQVADVGDVGPRHRDRVLAEQPDRERTAAVLDRRDGARAAARRS